MLPFFKWKTIHVFSFTRLQRRFNCQSAKHHLNIANGVVGYSSLMSDCFRTNALHLTWRLKSIAQRLNFSQRDYWNSSAYIRGKSLPYGIVTWFLVFFVSQVHKSEQPFHQSKRFFCGPLPSIGKGNKLIVNM